MTSSGVVFSVVASFVLALTGASVVSCCSSVASSDVALASSVLNSFGACGVVPWPGSVISSDVSFSVVVSDVFCLAGDSVVLPWPGSVAFSDVGFSVVALFVFSLRGASVVFPWPSSATSFEVSFSVVGSIVFCFTEA